MSNPESTIKLEMDRDLPRGVALALDESRRVIGEVFVPKDKPPERTRTLVLSIEDWGAAMSALGWVKYV